MKNNRRYEEQEEEQRNLQTSRENLLRKYGIEINKKPTPTTERYHPYKPSNLHKKRSYDDYSDDEDDVEEVPEQSPLLLLKRKPIVEHKRAETLIQSDSEDELEEPRKITSRRTKNKLDADGVNLINNLVKFCPKHSDEEAIWQHIKKCITIPPVQLYTKSAVMNYMKRQGHLR